MLQSIIYLFVLFSFIVFFDIHIFFCGLFCIKYNILINNKIILILFIDQQKRYISLEAPSCMVSMTLCVNLPTLVDRATLVQ